MNDRDKSSASRPGPAPEGETRPDERSSSSSGGSRGGGRHGGRRHFPPNQPHRPEPALNMDELRDLVELIAAHGFTDFELEREGFRVRLRRDLIAPPATVTENLPLPALASAPVLNSPAEAAQTPTAAVVPDRGPSAPASTVPPAAEAALPAPKAEELQMITSPIVGTFYRSASPTAEPFVRVGSTVEPSTVVCIIEAMKLMNEIQAEVRGVVEKIFVENGQPVEYGQPLFGIRR